eukprot:GILI01028924.1.p1 GENE.GILI01028924.1~~GILI01028924.1.p1  ORF type:complete len:143 (-),score=5.35 GILI01028924.1:109-537(-)
MSAMQLCIRCGSKEHSTRDHDEGKTGAAPIKSGTGAGSPAASPKAAQKRATSASPTSKGKNSALYVSPSRVQPPNCWKSVGRNPGIKDIIAPKIIERRDDGECIAFLSDVPGGLKIGCPCKVCQRKAEKAIIDTLRRQGKMD